MYNHSGKYILAVCPNPSVDTYARVNGFQVGEVNRLTEEVHYPGGKGVHVGLAAAELEEQVAILGIWGGPTGQWIKNECEKYSNVKCVGPEVDQWSRSCYTFKSDGEFDDTELLGVGPSLQEGDFNAFLKQYKGLLADAKCITLSGSWPNGSPENAYAQLIKEAKKENKATFIDCTGVQFDHAIIEKPYLVHLNRSEATSVFKINDVREATFQLANKCEYAAVTDGVNGMYFSDGEKIIHANCKIDSVHSAVGCGDCLTAGLAVAYVREMNDMISAKMGVACGAANCLREDLGMLYKKDVDKLFQQTATSGKLMDYTTENVTNYLE